MDAAGPDETDVGEIRLPVIRNREWTQEGSLEVWLSRAFVPKTIYESRFPHWVSSENAAGEPIEYVRTYHSYVSPDGVDDDGVDIHRAQQRLDAKYDYRYWYSASKRDPRLPAEYRATDPILIVRNLLVDMIRDGKIDPETPVFAWQWDRPGKNGATNQVELVLHAGKFSGAVRLEGDDWKTIGYKPKAQSLIGVVRVADPSAGPHVMVTVGSIAADRAPRDLRVYKPLTKFKWGSLFKTISDQQDLTRKQNEKLRQKGKTPRFDPDAFDPWINPYPIEFCYNEHALPADKYTLRLMKDDLDQELVEFTPEVKAAIDTPITDADLAFLTQPRQSACEELYDAMVRAASDANFTAIDFDQVFERWRARDTGSKGATIHASSKGPIVCSCGMHVDATWDACPFCGAQHAGPGPTPDLDSVIDDGGMQSCAECGHHATLDAGTCPACNAELPIQSVFDTSDLNDDYQDLE